MPEGDSIHRAARALQALVGQRLSAASPHPRGAALGIAPRLDGRRLEGVRAVGKNVVLSFEGGLVLRSHLRMNGRWRVQPRGTATRGRPWLVLRGEELEAVQWNGPVLELGDAVSRRLGPDILGERSETGAMQARLRNAPALPLGEALQQQRLVSGIGNMWAAEALWAARVSPWLRVAEVPDEALERVLTTARQLMSAALADERPPRRVYGRAGRPCRRCGTAVRSHGLGEANRTTYWCPTCQPSEREPALSPTTGVTSG